MAEFCRALLLRAVIPFLFVATLGCSEAIPVVETATSSSGGLLSLTNPATGAVLAGNTAMNITWTSQTNLFDANPIDLEYSQDGGVSWIAIASSLANSGSYAWYTPMIDNQTVQFRIKGHASGAVLSATNTNVVIDSTTPSFNLLWPVGGELVAANSAVTISWTPVNDLNLASIAIEVSEVGGGTWTTLTSAAPNTGSFNWTTPNIDSGTMEVRVTAKDMVGHITPISPASYFIVDKTGPGIALSTPSGGEVFKGGAITTIAWNAADNFSLGTLPTTLEYSQDSGATWATIATSLGGSGSLNWTVPTLNSSTVRVRATVVDVVGHSSTTATSDFTVDSSAPVLAAGGMLLDNGGTISADTLVGVDLSATDALTKISHFCLKTGVTTQPILTDVCWVAVNATPPNLTPSQTLALNDFSYLIGFVNGTKTIYAWVRDEAGNISTLSNSGAGTAGQDKATINVAINEIPTVTEIIVANTPSHSNQPTAAERAFNIGDPVYIKWQASDDNFGTTPMSVYYTTDDTTFTLIANNLANGSNASCVYNSGTPTSDDSMTGCYTWTNSLTSGTYFRIKVIATDSYGQTHSVLSQPMNTGFSLVAGKLDSGLGDLARRTIFAPDAINIQEGDPESLVVKSNGDMFFRDISKGLIFISAQTGIAQVLIPTTGITSGDGGPASSATFKMPLRIILDSSDNLLIFDYDRIRKLNTSTNTITNFIGGGGSSNDDIPPASLFVGPPAGSWGTIAAKSFPFFTLPNGNVYFQADKFGWGYTQALGAKIRYYDAATGLIKSFNYSGFGTSASPTTDVSLCNFRAFAIEYNPSTSAILSGLVDSYYGTNCTSGFGLSSVDAAGVVQAPYPLIPTGISYNYYLKTGRDGALYAFSRMFGKAYKYNRAANSWASILGTGTTGYCPDGTAANSCAVTLYDLHIMPTGQVYMVDNNVIRVIDEMGMVRTVYGFSVQNNIDENVSATSTYLGKIMNFYFNSYSQPILLDRDTRRVREVGGSGLINTIAGDGKLGAPSTSVAATATPFYDDAYLTFAVNEVTNEVYYEDSTRILKLNRTTAKWQSVVGLGATSYSAADGLLGSAINLSEMDPGRVVGFDGTNILTAKNKYTSGYTDSMLKLYDTTAGYLQTHFSGVLGAAALNDFSADGNAVASSQVPFSFANNYYGQPQYVTSLGWYFLNPIISNTRIVSMTTGGFVGTLVTLPVASTSFAYDMAGNRVFYCTTSGTLYSKGTVSGTVTAISLPASTTCVGNAMIYKSGDLYFPVTIDGATYGILRYEGL